MPDRLLRDRRDAGATLADLLDHYRGNPDVVVLGLPRGGVPVAYEVATALGAPLDVFVVRDYSESGDSQADGFAAAFGAGGTCGEEVVDQLVDPERRTLAYARQDSLIAEDELFFAARNAKTVIVAAESPNPTRSPCERSAQGVT